MHLPDLNKMDSWKTIVGRNANAHEWIDSGSDSSDSSGDDDDDDDDDDESDEEDSEMDTD